jgi:hypothetical protein
MSHHPESTLEGAAAPAYTIPPRRSTVRAGGRPYSASLDAAALSFELLLEISRTRLEARPVAGEADPAGAANSLATP